jgi:hypothetical protein
VARKRVKALAVHLSSPSPPGGYLLNIHDDISAISYLVGTGAALSLLPHRSLQAPSGPTIVIANGGVIPSRNFVFKKLSFNNQIFTTNFFKQTFLNPFWAQIFSNNMLFTLISKPAASISSFSRSTLPSSPLLSFPFTLIRFLRSTFPFFLSPHHPIPPSQLSYCHPIFHRFLSHSQPFHSPSHSHHLPAAVT